MKSQKRKPRKRRDTLVLKLLIIVALVLVVFEGQLVATMVSQYSGLTVSAVSNSSSASADSISADSEGSLQAEISAPADSAGTITTVIASNTGHMESCLAGIPDIITVRSSTAPVYGETETETETETEAPTLPTVSDPDSPAIVQETEPAVEDSYFSDAAFIGDSRMEGFRNSSGITQGTFFTSVGMSLSSMTSKEIISTSDGNITVAAALSGGVYNKIYIMLGTNDLGEYDWDNFRDGFISVTKRFQELQPDAIFYICSVIYVEESKVETGDYINNANVDTINSILLDVCEEKGYYYIDFNEILTNGYGSIIEDATSDGVHIYPRYCEKMLEYLKTHYVSAGSTGGNTETESETEDAEKA